MSYDEETHFRAVEYLRARKQDFPADLDDHCTMMDRNLNAYHGTGRYDLRDEEGLYRLRRAYYGLVSYMDDKVGGLLDALDETGRAESTVVVFASDHGDMLCERGMVQKRCFYEGSCRVPLIVRYPDGWRAGTTSPHPVSLIDLLPTFCDLAAEGTHRQVEEALRGHILDRFDPDAMARENLASLYRRRLIRDTMKRHGHTWSHDPAFDHRRGAMDQYR